MVSVSLRDHGIRFNQEAILRATIVPSAITRASPTVTDGSVKQYKLKAELAQCLLEIVESLSTSAHVANLFHNFLIW